LTERGMCSRQRNVNSKYTCYNYSFSAHGNLYVYFMMSALTFSEEVSRAVFV